MGRVPYFLPKMVDFFMVNGGKYTSQPWILWGCESVGLRVVELLILEI